MLGSNRSNGGGPCIGRLFHVHTVFDELGAMGWWDRNSAEDSDARASRSELEAMGWRNGNSVDDANTCASRSELEAMGWRDRNSVDGGR